MHETIDLASRLAGAAFGHLVGDAVGVPYEFLAPGEIGDVTFRGGGVHGRPAGTWSDDGALMLALLDSLLQPAGFEPDDQARRALAWHRDGAYTPDGEGLFDIGGATQTAIRAIGAGAPALDAGPAGDRDCGNGSLMRILPLALVGRDLATADLIDRAHLASRVTHGHPRCQVACAAYVLAVRELLGGVEPDAALASALGSTRAAYAGDEAKRPHLVALDELEAWSERGGRGFVLDAFWSAWDAFSGATGYEDTIRRAIAYGRDTDTTAAIAGGLAGARWGRAAIPLDWRRGLRGREVATPIIDRLLATTGSSANALRGAAPRWRAPPGRVGRGGRRPSRRGDPACTRGGSSSRAG